MATLTDNYRRYLAANEGLELEPGTFRVVGSDTLYKHLDTKTVEAMLACGHLGVIWRVANRELGNFLLAEGLYWCSPERVSPEMVRWGQWEDYVYFMTVENSN